MKKITLLFTLFFFSLTINAQEGHKKGKERIRALKIAYLTEKLDLSANEAEKFWPVYNHYNKKKRELFSFEKKEVKQKVKEGYDLNDVTDKDAEAILKKIYKLREERHKNKIAFNKTLLKILPAKKILLLEITEHEFNKKLMRKLKDKKEY